MPVSGRIKAFSKVKRLHQCIRGVRDAAPIRLCKTVGVPPNLVGQKPQV